MKYLLVLLLMYSLPMFGSSINTLQQRVSKLEKRIFVLERRLRTRKASPEEKVKAMRDEVNSLNERIKAYEIELIKYRRYFLAKTSIKKAGIKKRVNKINMLKRRLTTLLRSIEFIEIKNGIKGNLVY